MSLCFLHARESSFLVTRCESSHLLELPQLQTGRWLLVLGCLPVCPSAAPAHPRSCGNGRGNTLQSPLCRFLAKPRKSKTSANPPRATAAKQWAGSSQQKKIPRDFLGMGLDLGKVSVIQLGSAKLKYPLKASDKAGESE